MKVGILGLQGDVREHSRAIEAAGGTPVVVKRPAELAGVDALILPGGESTTIGKLLDRFGLLGPLRARAREGMPVYGTCAGAILLAREVVGEQQIPHSIGVLDISIRRNAYGRQIDSFESDLDIDELDGPFRAVFIRAPVIEGVGEGVEVLASHDGHPVLVRQGSVVASTFHPEMTADARVHAMFMEVI
ncbi:MAG: pyridoxal 5-phosphate synthase pdxT subunit [Actinomycetota bacterium]|jgi:5'-phosphate synthase pdxT subunit|nr:pyridoxal 5-phosphate synthase pdxT subunit [Actinomycetota bacterium]